MEKILIILNAGKDTEKLHYSYVAGGNKRSGTSTLEDVWQYLTKLNILLAYRPAFMFLGIYPKKLKT